MGAGTKTLTEMKFNEQVKDVLWRQLQKEGYSIDEESENLVVFTCGIQQIRFIYDYYDYTHLVSIGKGNESYSLDSEVVKMVFGLEILLGQVPRDIFLNNAAYLFRQKEGIDILRGETDKLEQAVKEYSATYTKALLKRQDLTRADNAWENRDYQSFIEIMNQMDMPELAESYRKKYEITQKKSKD